MSDWTGMLEWMRDTIRESRSRRRTECPQCGYGLVDDPQGGGGLWCPFDGWRGR